jgi:hypothetical protein
MAKAIAIATCILLFSFTSQAQENEKEIRRANHNVKTATTLALVPGLGQIYNQRYWKAPIVWGALSGTGYLYYDINRDYNTYKDVLIHITENPDLDSRTLLEADRPDLYGNLPKPTYQLTASGIANEAIGYMEYYRSQREYAVLGILGVYLLNILDANIDAHLFRFDVSDDLSIQSTIIPIQNSHSLAVGTGFRITYSLP